MNRQLYHILALLPLLAALTACTWNESLHDPFQSPSPSDKTPIELSVGGVDAPTQTRAVVTDGTDKTLHAFTATTRIYTVMKAEKDEATTKWAMTWGTASVPSTGDESPLAFASDQQLYWDDAYARDTKLSIYGLAVANKQWSSATIGSVTDYSFWNTTVNNLKCTLSVPTTQTSDNIYNFDVCYSNNLANNNSGDVTDKDKRLVFNTTTKKFDSDSKMIFYRAMCLFTIKIYAGEGFTLTQTALPVNPTDEQVYEHNFVFDDFRNKNVALNGFNYTGSFNIATGTWESTTSGTFTSIDNPLWPIGNRSDAAKAGTEPVYTLYAQLVPGTDICNETTANAFDLTIDGNRYQISMKTLYDAIKNKKNSDSQYAYGNGSTVDDKYLEEGTKLKQGVNYEFSFTIGKTKIDNITAQIADWEIVTAEEITPTNARIKLNLKDRGTNIATTSNYSFFRSKSNYDATGIDDNYTKYDWTTGYTVTDSKTTPSFVDEADPKPDHWTTSWYWDSNKHFYHFRALGVADNSTPVKLSVPSDNVTQANDGDYYAISSGETYKDLCWGAPFSDANVSDKFAYGPTTNGFDGSDNIDFSQDANKDKHQIYKAIGPTEDPIKLILFHMMSDVTFKVQTTAVGQPDRVNLGNGDTEKTTIKLEEIHTTGKLFMGNGLVLGSTDDVANSSYTFTATPAPTDGVITWANYGAIPQDLTNVILVITTPDHNQYKVAMKDVLAAATSAISSNNIANPYNTVQSGTNAGKYIINRWYPGFKYTYTFTLKKTGITNIQATIVDWETVTADDETVQIQ